MVARTVSRATPMVSKVALQFPATAALATIATGIAGTDTAIEGATTATMATATTAMPLPIAAATAHTATLDTGAFWFVTKIE